MHWGMMIPIVAIASGPVGWVATTWIRARHGYALTNRDGEVRDHDLPVHERRRMAALTDENQRQTQEIAALHKRLAVLERIATDPATRVTAEIEALRDARADSHTI